MGAGHSGNRDYPLHVLRGRAAVSLLCQRAQRLAERHSAAGNPGGSSLPLRADTISDHADRQLNERAERHRGRSSVLLLPPQRTGPVVAHHVAAENSGIVAFGYVLGLGLEQSPLQHAGSHDDLGPGCRDVSPVLSVADRTTRSVVRCGTNIWIVDIWERLCTSGHAGTSSGTG